MKLNAIMLALAALAPVAIWAQAAQPAAAQTPPQPSPSPSVTVKGVVLLGDAAQLRAGGWPAAELPAGGVDASRVPHAPDDLARQLAPLMAQDAVPLDAVTSYVAQALAQTQLPFAMVTVPPQDVTSGVLQVLVTTARLGRVRVEGARHFSEGSYRDVLRAQPGQPVDKRQLDEDLQWIGRNPFRRAAVVAERGANPGEVDLVLQAQDRAPWRFTAAVDNSGTPSTGREKISTGIAWGDAFGTGAQLAYNLSFDKRLQRNVTHSVSLAQDLRWRHALRMNAVASRIEPELLAPLNSVGHSRQFSLRYDMPRAPLAGFSQTLTLGFDWKHSDNNLLFAAIPVSGNVTRLWQGAVGWQAHRGGSDGHAAGVDATLYLAPGGIGPRSDDAAFDASRQGARARYAMLNIQGNYSRPLPARLMWVANASAQLATTNLLGSEQLSASGAFGVRGFAEGHGYGDQGVVLRNELHFAPVSPLAREDRASPQDQLTPLIFLDVAAVSPRRPLPGEASDTTLASVGAGIRYRLGNGSLRLDWGRPVRDSTGRGGSGRLHLAASFSW